MATCTSTTEAHLKVGVHLHVSLAFPERLELKVQIENNKQLLDEIEHDIMNDQNRGLCYLP